NRTPFTVEANARSHSLYVDDGGRIGSRTSTPSVEIHTIDRATPTLRLQQDGSSGFAPQTWDVAGNETNFFIRDVTNGSQLPFRIRPDAPTSSIFIDVNGDIGLGTSSPDADLHIVDTTGNAQLTLESDSSDWRMTNLDSNGHLLFQRDSGSGFEDVFAFRTIDAGLPAFSISKTMSVAGEVEASSHDVLSSREFKTELETLNGTATLDSLVRMPISSWRYTWEESGERRLGPMAEDFTAAFEVGDGRSISLGDASAVALSAIQGLNQRLFDQLEKRDTLIQALEARISELEQK
ncbi:MAG: hypothetical protein GY719_19695, partial [bacterium]|nr:hypothetical protein [bacterium]